MTFDEALKKAQWLAETQRAVVVAKGPDDWNFTSYAGYLESEIHPFQIGWDSGASEDYNELNKSCAGYWVQALEDKPVRATLGLDR